MGSRRLTPADAVWLYSEWEKNGQTVSALMWTDQEVDPAELTSIITERLLDKYPTFTQRIRKSRNPLYLPHWEDDPDFDLDNHFQVDQLPEPGGKEQLAELIGEQRSVLLPRDRPLWKVHLIQGYRGGSAMHLRIQHSIADGWALVRLFLSLADFATEPPKTVDKQRRRKRDMVGRAAQPAVDAVGSVTGTVGKAADAVKGVIKEPSSITAQIAQGQDALEETLGTLDPRRLLEFGEQVPAELLKQYAKIDALADVASGGAKDTVDFVFTPKPGTTILHGDVGGTKKVAWIEPIPLDEIKAIGRSQGATINDVVMAAQTYALRMYLKEKDALTVEELLTMVPISLRKADDPLPRTLGNKFGLLNILLPVGLEDPLDQVRVIKDQIDEIKGSQMPVISFGLTSVSSILTPDLEQRLHKVVQAQSIGVTTNVPGPREPMTLAGANVLGAWGMGGVSGNMNMSFGIFSLNGELNFAVHSDTALTPDPERVAELFLEAVDKLKQATGVGIPEEETQP